MKQNFKKATILLLAAILVFSSLSVGLISATSAQESNAGKPREPKQAYEMCYADSIDSSSGTSAAPEGINSGWELDNRAGVAKTNNNNNGIITDIMTDEHSRLLRYFNKTSDGKLDLQFRVIYTQNFNGNVLCLYDENDKPIYRIVTQNNDFYLNGALVGSSIGTRVPDGCEAVFRIIIDLDNSTSDTYIKLATPYGDVFRKEAKNTSLTGNTVSYLSFETLDETINTTEVKGGYIQVNYAVFEDFSSATHSTLYGSQNNRPVEAYEFTGGAEYASDKRNSCMSLPSGVTAIREFDPLVDNVCFSLNAIFKNMSEGEFVLCSNNTAIAKITAQNGKIYVNGEREIKEYNDKLWYGIRLEADVTTQKTVIKVSNKIVDTVDFLAKADFINKISLKSTKGDVWVDDVMVYNLLDYDVPEPVAPEGSDDYTIGINVCSLWENGACDGWATISPYDEIKPVLGYYDENYAETADWEIKYMVEHGIDFQAFCWFGEVSDAPLKSHKVNKHLNNAFLNSKYGDMMKFCLIWEAGNGAIPADNNAFQNYFVPYWIENYFSNSSYMTIDNKPVLAIFGVDKLIDKFGTGLKTQFEYMRGEVKKLGYDDMIILSCNAGETALEQYGFDGWYAYNWNTQGYSYDVNVAKNIEVKESKDVYTVPTVSVGFGAIGWYQDRYPLMTVEDFEKTNNWIKNTDLKSRTNQPTWAKNLVMMSTWNEYGEGTYMMPCEDLNGFGYLDVIRNVYTDGGEHEDVKPTAEQLKRITNNYPQERRILRDDGYYETPASGNSKTFEFTSEENVTKYIGHTSMAMQSVGTDGVTYTTNTADPYLLFNKQLITDLERVVSSGLTADNVVSVRIIAKGMPKNEAMKLYFATDTNTVKDEKKTLVSGRLGTGDGAYQEYVLNVSEHDLWNGKLTDLMLRPCHTNGATITIKSITFDFANQRYYDFTKLQGDSGNYITKGANCTIFGDADGMHISTGNDPDAIIYLDKMVKDLSPSDIAGVRVTASGIPTDGNGMELFYYSDTQGVDEQRKIRVTSAGTEEREFVFDLTAKTNWEGTTAKLRLDPFQAQNTTVTIKSITIDLANQRYYDFTKLQGDSENYITKGANCTITGDADGMHISTGNNNDAIIYLDKMVEDLSPSDIAGVRVTASGIPAGGNGMELFYYSDTQEVSGNRKIRVTSTGTEEREFVFDLTAKTDWDGTIAKLRLDPFEAQNTTVTIKSITIELRNNPAKLFVNGVKMNNKIQCESDGNGVVYFPFEPSISLVQNYLYTYFNWDKANKTLTLYRDKHSYQFKAGNNYALVDGTTQFSLGGKVYLRNGIPMLPIKGLANVLNHYNEGITLNTNANDTNAIGANPIYYYIDTPEKSNFNEVTQKTGEWVFSKLGNAQGWTASNSNISFGNGFIRITPIVRSDGSCDPILYSPSDLNLSCNEYKKVELKCRWNVNQSSDVDPGFYFTTNSAGISEATHFKVWLSPSSANCSSQENKTETNREGYTYEYTVSAPDSENFVTITFDLSTMTNYTGTLKQLRFDPFDTKGICDVAYIKLY